MLDPRFGKFLGRGFGCDTVDCDTTDGCDEVMGNDPLFLNKLAAAVLMTWRFLRLAVFAMGY